MPAGQLFRYVLTGAWNTLFGYGTFALFTALLAPLGRQSYMLALIPSAAINITVAFLGYKWFVFKTKGNYLREWIRCVGVYSSSMALSMVLLPVFVFVIRHRFGLETQAPYIAGALLGVLTVIFSFFGHKHISFRQS
ncbi:MAG: GtrA family protein [Candidatus Korobacteraceae bacterium]